MSAPKFKLFDKVIVILKQSEKDLTTGQDNVFTFEKTGVIIDSQVLNESMQVCYETENSSGERDTKFAFISFEDMNYHPDQEKIYKYDQIKAALC